MCDVSGCLSYDTRMIKRSKNITVGLLAAIKEKKKKKNLQAKDCPKKNKIRQQTAIFKQ